MTDYYKKGRAITLKELIDNLPDYFPKDDSILNVNLKDRKDEEGWKPIFSGTFEAMLLELQAQVRMNGSKKEVLLVDYD